MAGLLAHGLGASRRPSRSRGSSGVVTGRSPLTVAGAAAALHRVPFSPSAWKDHRPCLYARLTQPVKGRILAPLTLVLGGARSGKSRHAEGLLAGLAGRVYV